MIECVRWCLNELIRRFWTGDKDVAAKAVRELLEFDVPCIGKFGNSLLVQRTDLTTAEEILVLLHYAGEDGLSRRQLGKFVRASPSSVTIAIDKLTSPKVRQLALTGSGNLRLTDLGAKRLREKLADKLVVQ